MVRNLGTRVKTPVDVNWLAWDTSDPYGTGFPNLSLALGSYSVSDPVQMLFLWTFLLNSSHLFGL